MPKSKTPAETPLNPIAKLYSLWALNPLVEIAIAIAHDAAVRPQNYRQLPPEIIKTLNDFRFKVGTLPDWPDAFQRTLSFKVLYHVCIASPPLREAALATADHQRDTEKSYDQASFREAIADFRTRISPLAGDAMTMLLGQTEPIFGRAVALFQEPAITRAFGASAAPADDWPIGRNFSGEAANMIAAVVRGLRDVACLSGWFRRLNETTLIERRLVPPIAVDLSADKFLTLQRAAFYGAQTISASLLNEPQDEFNLINNARQWAKSLQKLIPDSTRAWKDIDYRATLTDLEWGMAPNPSGETAPSTAAPLAAQTFTASGEICCCSGDLDCDPTSQLTDHCSEYQCTFAVIGGCPN